MPRRHPRDIICSQAELGIRNAIADIVELYKLSDAEQLQVVMNACNGNLNNLVRHMIRDERHPDDPNKPGGLA